MRAAGIFTALLAAALTGLACPVALAQLPPAGTRPPDMRPELKPAPGLDIKPLAPPAAKPAITGTVTVTRFRFSGATAVTASELEPVVAPWIGRPLSASELADAVNTVTAYLRERGLFVAYARLPDQRIADGEVEIAIVEGRIGKVAIEMADDARLKRSVAEGFLTGVQRDTVIERGTFDTPLLLLNDLPGVRVTPVLTPGEAPGTADLSVRVEDERLVSGYVRADNYETRELGQYELTGYLRLRNPLGIGDLVTAQVTGTHTGGRKRGTLSYSLPVNHLGTRVGALLSEQRYRVGGAFGALRSSGDSTSMSLVATHPLVRAHDRNLTGAVSLNQTDYSDRIDALGFSSETRHSLATFALIADLTDGWLGGGRSGAYLEYQSGRVSVHTLSPGIANALGLGPDGTFERARVRADRLQRVFGESSVLFSMTAQLASQNLAAGRELQLSGPDGVRAYPTEELLVDEGYLARIEYRHDFPAADSWRSRVTLFFDYGHGRVNKEPLFGAGDNTRSIAGYGVALELLVKNSFSVQAALAWRAREAPLTDPDRNPRAWLAVTQSF